MRDFLGTVLIVVLIVAGIVGVIFWTAPLMEAGQAKRHEERVTLCMRAYEFSRDRCEFILSNGGRDLMGGMR